MNTEPWVRDLAEVVGEGAKGFLLARGVTHCECTAMTAGLTIMQVGLELALQNGVTKRRVFHAALKLVARVTEAAIVAIPLPAVPKDKPS
ncbi:hypothetical protein [Sorangium sp. So ce1151]|uniref:hypothetical protein n=1 Tax=Sorangium sp. So ce1151 TaxID=3133332 RepID=UPI003F6290EE